MVLGVEPKTERRTPCQAGAHVKDVNEGSASRRRTVMKISALPEGRPLENSDPRCQTSSRVDRRSTDDKNITRTLWTKSSSTRVLLVGFRRPVAGVQEKLQALVKTLIETYDMSKVADSIRHGLEQAVADAILKAAARADQLPGDGDWQGIGSARHSEFSIITRLCSFISSRASFIFDNNCSASSAIMLRPPVRNCSTNSR
jgi:hypothetical protein